MRGDGSGRVLICLWPRMSAISGAFCCSWKIGRPPGCRMDPVLLLLELGASGLGHDEDLSVFTDQIRDVSRAVSCTYVLLTVYRTQSDSVLTFATPSRRNPSSRLSGIGTYPDQRVSNRSLPSVQPQQSGWIRRGPITKESRLPSTSMSTSGGQGLHATKV